MKGLNERIRINKVHGLPPVVWVSGILGLGDGNSVVVQLVLNE